MFSAKFNFIFNILYGLLDTNGEAIGYKWGGYWIQMGRLLDTNGEAGF
jgi:hypothetical protein